MRELYGEVVGDFGLGLADVLAPFIGLADWWLQDNQSIDSPALPLLKPGPNTPCT